jgi:two-component system sensor histidine kinase VicK
MLGGLLTTHDLTLIGLGFLLAVLLYFFIVRPRQQHIRDEALDRSRDQFIGLASHYLITPITIIQTALAQLQEGDLRITPVERQRLYEIIRKGQQRLWIIAEQFVLISELEQGELRLKSDVNSIEEVVLNAVSSVDVFAREKKLTLLIENALGTVREERFDKRRVRQALIAMLDNAVKFSLEGGKVVVRMETTEDELIVTVYDEGIGMPEDVLRHVTEKFYRGSGIYNFNYEGLGLGLHIAYAIARLHGGVVEFESRQQHGTVARLRLQREG